MNVRPEEHSGSRREPAPGLRTDGAGLAGSRWRGRAPLVALATGIVALGGVGGFALGRLPDESDQASGSATGPAGDGSLPGAGAGVPGEEQGEEQGEEHDDVAVVEDGDDDGDSRDDGPTSTPVRRRPTWVPRPTAPPERSER